MPRVVKKRREAADGDGLMEEYYDMLFPDDEEEGRSKPAFKLLQMAHAWRAQQQAKEQEQQQEQAQGHQGLEEEGPQDGQRDSDERHNSSEDGQESHGDEQ